MSLLHEMAKIPILQKLTHMCSFSYLTLLVSKSMCVGAANLRLTKVRLGLTFCQFDINSRSVIYDFNKNIIDFILLEIRPLIFISLVNLTQNIMLLMI